MRALVSALGAASALAGVLFGVFLVVGCAMAATNPFHVFVQNDGVQQVRVYGVDRTGRSPFFIGTTTRYRMQEGLRATRADWKNRHVNVCLYPVGGWTSRAIFSDFEVCHTPRGLGYLVSPAVTVTEGWDSVYIYVNPLGLRYSWAGALPRGLP